jgi:hypothetical protein
LFPQLSDDSRTDFTTTLGGKQESSRPNQGLETGKEQMNEFFSLQVKQQGEGGLLFTRTPEDNRGQEFQSWGRQLKPNKRHYEELNQRYRPIRKDQSCSLTHTLQEKRKNKINSLPLVTLKWEVALQREILVATQNQSVQNIQKTTVPPAIDEGASSE